MYMSTQFHLHKSINIYIYILQSICYIYTHLYPPLIKYVIYSPQMKSCERAFVRNYRNTHSIYQDIFHATKLFVRACTYTQIQGHVFHKLI